MTTGAWRIGLLLGLAWDEPGGVQRVVRGLAREFMRRGHSVSILALGEHEFEGVQAGMHVRLLPKPCAPDDWSAFNRSPEFEAEAVRWSVERDLDVIHLQHLSSFGLGLPGRLRELQREVFATLHDDWLVCPRGQMWRTDDVACESIEPATCATCWAQTWPQIGNEAEALPAVRARLELARVAVDACTQVFVPSTAARELAIRWGARPERLKTLANGIEQAGTPLPRREFDAKHIQVGVLGAVQPSKGVPFLARVIADLDAPFQLHVHGPCTHYHGDRRHLEELETLAAESACVRLHGAYESEDLARLLSELDLVCVPSLWHEVHGLVAREALLAGVPVFVAARGGLLDVPSLQLPAGDEVAWKEALQRFATDPEWRAARAPGSCKLPSVSQSASEHLAAYGAAL